MSLINQLRHFVPTDIAILFNQTSVSYSQLIKHVTECALWLQNHHIKSACINMQNSYEWVVIDLACQHAKAVCTPIPQFFSQQQIKHLVDQVQPDVVFGASPNANTSYKVVSGLSVKAFFMSKSQACEMPINTSKITFTSGSTGTPKGVCLSSENQLIVASSLVSAIGVDHPKHLVLLPLATLLENIAGIYAPLLAQGQVTIVSDDEKGLRGNRLIDLKKLLNCISAHRPNTMILVPELLQALIVGCSHGWQPPPSLTFIAVGGAKVDAAMIVKARELGLPVFQGYGLSECGSVVSICTNTDEPRDSAGQALKHIQLTQLNGELVVSGNCFLGYLGEPKTWYPTTVNTGDLVDITNHYLFIQGRIKHLIINSYGRNISPEWIESKIAATGLCKQNIVVGDAKPHLCALLVPMSEEISRKKMGKAISAINEHLPDYAKIVDFIIVNTPFTQQNQLLTENGKLKRGAISCAYETQINQQYSQHALAAV
jgi:long-chain acyl-CoA synthetase